MRYSFNTDAQQNDCTFGRQSMGNRVQNARSLYQQPAEKSLPFSQRGTADRSFYDSPMSIQRACNVLLS